MKSHAIVAILGLALAAAPILAQETQNPPQGAPAVEAQPLTSEAAPATLAEPDPGEEIICRRERATGSLTRSTRICKTRNEWNLSRQEARQAMERYGNSGGHGQGCASGGQGC